ncbi:putative PLP-dependent enzyme possibly involved in cell wall biogenesis [Desulfitobacterium dichloroeliminans LMG P-21439]|uniref:Putative PLP-dependent enzyme possibly involved in cell wall biogenesis n=1 Tax=Desulfitobacterium dichloroeliminans (strain LMG P-21439 / DCA1) TaxID=871963 RepID=L0F5N9_DESDL|nr:aminotransferase class I/II-fold pyridoxal phosphate-dependent enzyme [Desulfitobacterium dichloroeliminans]AGA68360.1 putative PLP-dependent enzyme possibly involved in cell wall biogenesis [Desulfitobacterium dichloroeliminans LMG P-21439]
MDTEAEQRIYLSSPHMSGDEQDYIREAFATNWIAPLGPNVEAFERQVADYVGVQGAVALSSGTAALHLALKYLGVNRGDSVICSSLTFSASANPIIYEGGVPVFIDADPSNWNMSPQALARALEELKKTGKLPKAAIIVDLYGQSASMEPLLELLEHYQVPVIEDAAEALGATYQGKPCGSFGKFGVFSFNGNKIITTSGGGMLVSDNLKALDKVRFWATQARDKARHYQHSEIGYNYRLSNVLAGIGRGQMKVIDERVNTRRAIFDRYYAALNKVDGLDFMPEASYGRSNRWLTTLTLDPEKTGVTVNDVLIALEEHNIEARPVWKPLHLQPVFKDCPYYPHEIGKSVSDELFAKGICLPSGTNMTEAEQDRVIEIVSRLLK